MSGFFKCMHTTFLCYFNCNSTQGPHFCTCLYCPTSCSNMSTLISNQDLQDKRLLVFTLELWEWIVLCLFVSQALQEDLLFLPESSRNYVTLPNQVNSYRNQLPFQDTGFRLHLGFKHIPASLSFRLIWLVVACTKYTAVLAICKKNWTRKAYDLHVISHAGREQNCRSRIWSR